MKPTGPTCRIVGVLAFAVALGVCGCAKEPAPAPADSEAPASKSLAETAIGGFTGKNAVDAHKRASATIERINAEREADMREHLGE